MEKAKINEYSKMSLEQATNLLNDGKVDANGQFTSLTLKRGLVKDDGKTYIERRIFRNADMKTVVVYDLALPTSLVQAKEMFGEQDCLDAIWTAKRIKTDGEKAGKGQGDPEVTAQKASVKLVTSLRKLGKTEAANEIEALLKRTEEVKKSLKAQGFGK